MCVREGVQQEGEFRTDEERIRKWYIKHIVCIVYAYLCVCVGHTVRANAWT